MLRRTVSGVLEATLSSASGDLYVVDPARDTLEELVSEHADAVEASLDTGRLTLRSATETLEYALMLVEQPERTVACALVYANNGIAGAICNDSPDAVRWTEGVYERLRAEARPLHE